MNIVLRRLAIDEILARAVPVTRAAEQQAAQARSAAVQVTMQALCLTDAEEWHLLREISKRLLDDDLDARAECYSARMDAIWNKYEALTPEHVEPGEPVPQPMASIYRTLSRDDLVASLGARPEAHTKLA